MFSSNILFQASIVIKSVESFNSDGTITITFDWDERTNAWGNLQNANHIAEGDVIFYSNAFISVNPKMQSFIIKEILSKSSTTVQCKIESRDSSDPVEAIYASINQYCVISRPTSNLSLFPNVAPDGQSIPDFFSEHVSNFNLRTLDETISSLQQSGGGASVSVSATAPESPSEGDLWYDSEDLSLKIFYGNATDSAGDDVWVEISSTDSFVVQDGGGSVDLSGYVTQSELDSAGYLTSSDLSGYATNTDLDAVQAEVTAIKNAGETLDTFQELVDYVNSLDSAQEIDIINRLTTLQSDVDSNETSASDDRALIRTELSLQGSHLIHVDKYKSGNYIPDGSINKPYNTIQAAYDSTVEVSGVSTILIGPGDYVENLNISNNSQKTINFIGLGGSQSNTVAILGNVKIDGPQIKIQMKDIRIEGSDENQPALHVNGCRNSSFQNMTIRYGVDSEGNTVVPTENVLKVTSTYGTGAGIVDFLSCSIHPQTPDSAYPENGGILVDGEGFRQVRFYRCNYGANITMPLTNWDYVYLYQCAAFGNINHERGVIIVDQSQITGFYSTASIPQSLRDEHDFLQRLTWVNYVQITNSSLRLDSGGWGKIEKYGDSYYLIGNNDSNPNHRVLGGDSLGELEFQKALVSDPNADIEDYMGQSYLRYASEIYYSNKNNLWGQIPNESIPWDVQSALDSLKNDLVDIHDNLYRDGDILVKSGVRESFVWSVNNSNIDFPHDCDNGHIINMETPQTNIHLKLTNLGLSVDEATTITVVIEQGANAYIPNQLDIENVSQTIKWQGGTIPSGTVSGVDVISFSILRKSAASYLVLGQLVDFS